MKSNKDNIHINEIKEHSNHILRKKKKQQQHNGKEIYMYN